VSLTIRVDEDVYRDLTDVAKELGLSVNEIVNIYLSHLRYIMSIVKEDVDTLSKVFVDVPRDRLAVFSI
jgi:antitoxin component of RelBE/YafQ-DinJ toxin-antitoxin module